MGTLAASEASAQMRSLPTTMLPSEVMSVEEYPAGGEILLDSGDLAETMANDAGAWMWQSLPDGVIYRSYLAGVKEPRISGVVFEEQSGGWLADATLGGRVGILRYGTTDADRPAGWQLDVEGAAFPRLDLENDQDLVSSDFRFGIPLTYGFGAWQYKLAYFHQSSHLADEFLLENPGTDRINFARDGFVLGASFFPTDDLRLYAEFGYAFYTSGGSEPGEVQFGIDYSPIEWRGHTDGPFAAFNGHLREDSGYSGNFTAQLGWQWRGMLSGDLLRVGVQYYNGKSPQYQFFDEHEEEIGAGIWYDY
jgi:hypothetical protein